MLEEVFLPIFSAFTLGILTSISPCPLATNIAATSFLSQQFNKTRLIIGSGISYALGRVISYITIALLITIASIKINILAMFLQRNINKLIGPVLLISGLILLNIIRFNFSFKTPIPKKYENKVNANVINSFLLGFFFALSFCPISAALFFGSLIPITIKTKFTILLPAVFGFATGIPVLIFALLLAYSTATIAKYFKKVNKFELIMRKFTGSVFILAGLYYSLIYIFKITI